MSASAKKKPLAASDQDVKIPPAVRAAAEKAEQIHQAAYAPTPVEGDALPQPEPAAPATSAAPQPDAVAPVAPAPASAPVPVSEETWEHKFNSMKGRFDRERTINASLNERIANLEATIANMQAAPVAPASEAKPLLTPEEVAEYGADFLDVVKRRAAEVVTPEVAALRKQIDELNRKLGNVDTHVEKSAKAQMHDALNAAVPNWLEINKNEKFLDWLSLRDAYSGIIRQELLKQAYAANDTPRVLSFFKGFLAAEAAKAPSTATPDVPPTAPKFPLAELAAPGRAKTAAPPPAPVEKPIITRAQVTEFYADLAKGAYRGRDDEKASIEAMIFEANRDGRIR